MRRRVLWIAIGILASSTAHADEQFLKTAYSVLLGQSAGSIDTSTGNALIYQTLGTTIDGKKHEVIRAISEKQPCISQIGIIEKVSDQQINNRISDFYFRRVSKSDASSSGKYLNIDFQGDAINCMYTQPADHIPFPRACIDSMTINLEFNSEAEANAALTIWKNALPAMQKICPTTMP